MFISSDSESVARDSILDGSGQDILRAIELDWRRMCGNVQTPAPHGPDPYRMDLALPHMFILQRTGPGTARIRVAGQRLHDMVGNDPRGGSFRAFFADGACDTALELLETALTLPAIVRIPLRAARGFGRKPLRGEALLLPMRDAQGKLARVMGVILTENPNYTKAIRWEIDPMREVMCDVQEGNFPDRRTGPRQKVPAGTSDIAVKLAAVPKVTQPPKVAQTPKAAQPPKAVQPPKEQTAPAPISRRPVTVRGANLRLVVDNT